MENFGFRGSICDPPLECIWPTNIGPEIAVSRTFHHMYPGGPLSTKRSFNGDLIRSLSYSNGPSIMANSAFIPFETVREF